jgi:two-component system, LytTR family, response regulator
VSAKVHAVVVDDEPPARRELRRMLEEDDRVAVVGEAADVDTARGLLERTRPDLLFLDIRLGNRSGFDLLEAVDPETAVVFVTAYDEHAVRAFENDALDYLLKPVEAGRLRVSIERALARGQPARAAATEPRAFTPARWVFLDAEGGPEFIPLETIAHVEADGTRTVVHTVDGRARGDTRTLRAWEARLPAGDFLRVHRSSIVNLRHVERIEPWSHYGFRLHVRGAREPLAMSRRYATRIKELLG